MVGASVLCWVYLMAPYAQDPTLTILQKLISMAYPLMDLLLLAVLVRLAVSASVVAALPSISSRRASSPSSRSTPSTEWVPCNVQSGYATGGKLDIGWLMFYLLWGAAALHPSMRVLEQAEPETEPMGRQRLLVLAAASFPRSASSSSRSPEEIRSGLPA